MRRELVSKLESCVVKRGDFVLKSGIKSDIYIDFRQLISHPKILVQVAFELSQLISAVSLKIYSNHQSLVGIPFGGVPIACQISTILDIPMIYVRDSQKSHGTKKLIEGTVYSSTIIIDDVFTTGTSMGPYIKILAEHGITVTGIYVLLNRSSEKFFMGIPITSLYTLSDFSIVSNSNDNVSLSEFLSSSVQDSIVNVILEQNMFCTESDLIVGKLKEMSIRKNSNIILSVDSPDPEKFLSIIDTCGPHIVGVKMHLDIFPHHVFSTDNKNLDRDNRIYEYIKIFSQPVETCNIAQHFQTTTKDVNSILYKDNRFVKICDENGSNPKWSIKKNFMEQLLDLKIKHNLIYIEDRKYSDIGHIMKMQIENVKIYADIVTVHSIAGKKSIENCSLPAIIVCQMSCEKNLIDTLYTCKTLSMISSCSNIVGIVSQEKICNNILHFTPGISINSDLIPQVINHDDQGQQYTGKNSFTDFYIIGRSITDSLNILESVQKHVKYFKSKGCEFAFNNNL